MSKPVVMVPQPILPEIIAELEEKYDLKFWGASAGVSKEEFIRKNGGSVQALVVTPVFCVTRQVLSDLPKLEIVSTFSVGLDSIDLPACRDHGIAVTYSPDVVTDDTADTALALLLATMRSICAADRFVRAGLWTPNCDFPLARKVSGKRIGIVGMGRIGCAIARRVEGFGCAISYFSRSGKPELPYKRVESLVELARESDALIVACSLTPQTRKMINREVMDALGEQGTLVNIARGAIVDEEELVKALVEKRLGAAGLDVFDKEPNVPAELLALDNVVLLPHIGTATDETRISMTELVLRNLEAHFANQPLLTPVPA